MVHGQVQFIQCFLYKNYRKFTYFIIILFLIIIIAKHTPVHTLNIVLNHEKIKIQINITIGQLYCNINVVSYSQYYVLFFYYLFLLISDHCWTDRLCRRMIFMPKWERNGVLCRKNNPKRCTCHCRHN